MTSISKNPVDVRQNIYVDFNCPKFKVVDHARLSKYKNIFSKGYFPNWSEEVFVIKNTLSWTYVVTDLKGEEIVATFYEKKMQKTSQKESKVEKK